MSFVSIYSQQGANGYNGFSGYSVSIATATVTDVPAFSAVTVDWSKSITHSVSLSSNLSAINFTNARDGQTLFLTITNPSTYTVSWPLSTVYWTSGTAVVQTTGTAVTPKTDVYGFQYINGGYYATASQNYYYIPAVTGVVATGGTLTTANSYNQWAFNSSSTWTVTSPGIVYYAIVAGGGGGGGYSGGGGGAGAGGVVTGILSASAGTYSVIIGAGGTGNTGTSTYPTNGSISSLAGLSAVGGGAGAYVVGGAWVAPLAGGSGGGTGTGVTGSINIGGIGVAGQGWQGGYDINTGSPYPGGAGGGAGGVGGSGSGSQSGAGGPGLSIYLPASGVSTYVGGGGGGGGTYQGAAAGTGGTGGGGTGGTAPGGNATSGATNTGGGGGGGSNNSSSPQGTGGAGGSGIVYIWSPTSTSTKTPYIQYLVVAGGGGGGDNNGGGGGGGGVLQGLSAVNAGVSYTITVGAGGTGANNTGNGVAGLNSSISTLSIVASGGGSGGGDNGVSVGTSGGAGGSGGGGGYPNAAGGAPATGQGYYGGSAYGSGPPYSAAGGGGAGASAATSGSSPSLGGDGICSNITGTSTSWSNRFSGNGQYLVTPSSTAAFDLSNNPFTLECWFYTTSNKGYQNIFSRPGAADGNGWVLYFETNSTINFLGGSSNNWYVVLNTSTVPTPNTWYHAAVTRGSSNNFTLWLNGTAVATATTNYTWPSFSTYPFYIGKYPNFPSFNEGQDFGGYISNVRIVNGTCLYTSAFTPSTAPLSAVANTVLLTCQSPAFIDNGPNNIALTVTGTPSIASQNPFAPAYGGGGGGSCESGGTTAQGGMGGGGAGNPSATVNGAVAGTANTGGGAGGNNSSGSGGRSGGSGIVVISYPSIYSLAANTTGSPTLTTANGNNIYKFTATGSITF